MIGRAAREHEALVDRRARFLETSSSDQHARETLVRDGLQSHEPERARAIERATQVRDTLVEVAGVAEEAPQRALREARLEEIVRARRELERLPRDLERAVAVDPRERVAHV